MLKKIKQSKSEKALLLFVIILGILTLLSFITIKNKCLFVEKVNLNKLSFNNAENISIVMATDFFLLNKKSTDYLFNLLEDLDNIENKISQEYWALIREIHNQMYHNRTSKDDKHAKHVGVMIEHLLSQHIFNNGYLIDVFDTRLIKLIYSFKMFFQKAIKL